MLSLFSSNKSTNHNQPPLIKKTSNNFDVDSFVNKVAATPEKVKDSSVDVTKLLDVTQEKDIKAVPSKAMRKVLEANRMEKFPKDFQKASKKITQSLNKFISDYEANKDSGKHKAPEHHMDQQSHQNRVNKQRLENSDSFENNSKSLAYKNPGSKIRTNTSNKNQVNPSQQYIQKPKPKQEPKEDFLEMLEKLKNSKPDERLKPLKMQKQVSDAQSEGYNPLALRTIVPKVNNAPKKQEEKEEEEEKEEQYDPLGLRNNDAKKKQPSKMVKPEPTEVLKKRPLAVEKQSKYETKIVKKVKPEPERSRLEASVLSVFGSKVNKKPPPPGNSNPNSHRSKDMRHGNKIRPERRGEMEEEENESDREFIASEGEEEKDEIRKELDQITGAFRRGAPRRGDHEDDDMDAMEVGYEQFEEEDRLARRIAKREDKEELKYILMEQDQ